MDLIKLNSEVILSELEVYQDLLSVDTIGIYADDTVLMVVRKKTARTEEGKGSKKGLTTYCKIVCFSLIKPAQDAR